MIPPAGSQSLPALNTPLSGDGRGIAERAPRGAEPTTTAARSLIPDAVGPVRAAADPEGARTTALPRDLPAPPDPDAPTGPPPAFDATPLERLRLPLDEMAPEVGEVELLGMIRRVMAAAEPAAVPPPPAERALAGIEKLRSVSTGEPPRVDVFL